MKLGDLMRRWAAVGKEEKVAFAWWFQTCERIAEKAATGEPATLFDLAEEAALWGRMGAGRRLVGELLCELEGVIELLAGELGREPELEEVRARLGEWPGKAFLPTTMWTRALVHRRCRVCGARRAVTGEERGAEARVAEAGGSGVKGLARAQRSEPRAP